MLRKKYQNAGKFRIAMLKMNMPKLVKPVKPTDKDDIEEVETYKLELKDYLVEIKAQKKIMEWVLPIVLGQCSPTIWDRLKASDK